MGDSVFSVVPISTFAEFRNGKSLAPERYIETGSFAVYGSNGVIARTNEALYAEPVVVIGRVGAYCGSVHRARESCWVTDNAIVAMPKYGTDARYLYYRLLSLNLRATAIGSAQPLITQGGLNGIRTAACPLATQKAIAHILGTLDDKIELNRQMNETLEAMARALFKSWFVDFDPVRAKAAGRQPAGMDAATAKLFPDAFEMSELGEIPRGWRVSTIEDLTVVVTKGTTPTKSQGYATHGVRFVRVNAIDIHGEILADQLLHIDSETDEALSRSQLCAGDILVSIAGTIGRTAVVEDWLLPANVNQAVALLRPESSVVEPDLLFLHVCSPAIQKFFNERVVHAVQANLSLSTIKAATIALPNRERQRVLAAPISNFIQSVRRNRHEAQTLARLRDELLPRLLSGELSIPDAERFVGRAV